MTTRLYLIRHAEAEGNVLRRFQGIWDSKLSEKGFLQLEFLREKFKDIKIDAAFASDLERAKVTGEYAASYSGVGVVPDERFRELNFGEWENADAMHVRTTYPDDYFKYQYRADLFRITNGESFAEVAVRMKEGVDECLRENQGKTILIVSHSASIRAYLCEIMGISLSQIEKVGRIDNTSVSIVDFDEDLNATVVSLNDMDHLPEEIITDEGNRKYT